eukprot:09825_4
MTERHHILISQHPFGGCLAVARSLPLFKAIHTSSAALNPTKCTLIWSGRCSRTVAGHHSPCEKASTELPLPPGVKFAS